MRLKFYPNGTDSPKWPGHGHGDYPYIGRQFDVDTRENKACAEPAECESNSPEATRMLDHVRDNALLCADEATAKFCGVKFAKCVRDKDGNWGVAPPKGDK